MVQWRTVRYGFEEVHTYGNSDKNPRLERTVRYEYVSTGGVRKTGDYGVQSDRGMNLQKEWEEPGVVECDQVNGRSCGTNPGTSGGVYGEVVPTDGTRQGKLQWVS